MFKRRPHLDLRFRLAVTAGGLILLALGSGCVAWEPIFRGSLRLASFLQP